MFTKKKLAEIERRLERLEALMAAGTMTDVAEANQLLERISERIKAEARAKACVAGGAHKYDLSYICKLCGEKAPGKR